MLNVAVEHGAVTSVDGVVGLLAGFAELVGHGLVALRDTEFCKCLFLGHGAAPSIEVVVDGLLVVTVGLFVIAEVLADADQLMRSSSSLDNWVVVLQLMRLARRSAEVMIDFLIVV